MAIGLSGCGAGEPEDRKALEVTRRGVEICVDIEPVIGQTLQYLNNEGYNPKNNNNGTFKRAGNWCEDRQEEGDLIADVTSPDGTNVFRVAGSNPNFGYPEIQITCRDGSPSNPNHNKVEKGFDVGETISFTCNPYTIVATREADSKTLKHFQFLVRQA